jgi:hypothetical protein
MGQVGGRGREERGAQPEYWDACKTNVSTGINVHKWWVFFRIFLGVFGGILGFEVERSNF